MKNYLIILLLILISGIGFNVQSQDSPAVSLESNEDSVAIEVLDEPDGPYLSPESLQGILRQADSAARVEWDSPSGILRVDAGGRQMQAPLKNAVLDIDGTTRAVNAPLRMKSSGVIIPMQTAKLMLAALNLELEIAGDEDESGELKSQSGTFSMRTLEDSSALEDAGFTRSSPARASSNALPAIVLPQSIAGEIGLSWNQLADSRHTQAPRKFLITFDKELEAFASELRNSVLDAVGIDAQLMQISGRRNDPRVVAQVVGQYPDLYVDLMLSPTASAEGTGAGRSTWGVEIWTVHEALWPADRDATQDPASTVKLPYFHHEYHNLALASLVRAEVFAAFPGRSVLMELAPAYLLRRMNAPSIAILIPPALLSERGSAALNAADAALNAADAAAKGISHYVRGMQAVTGAP